jgi:hypothetical protein
MQQHIEDGCRRCEAVLQMWQSAASIAKQESAYAPPDDVVRIAKSQFVLNGIALGRGVRLLFDSALQPVTVGVRGSVSSRQFLYETDELYIDLRLEPPRKDVDRMCLVGQVLNRAKQSRVAHGLPVRLQKGKLPVTHTVTNQFGEFQLEFDAGNDLCVAIGDEANAIVLPIYGVHGKAEKDEADSI